MVKSRVIDVSYSQGVIDWEKVKPHIDGVIIRCGYGMDIPNQDDKYFKRNAAECTRLGIPFGVYLYSYADTEEKIRSEAAHVLRLVKGYKLSYPIYLDLEESHTRNGAVERAIIFGDIIEKAGYTCGIYANLNWWNNYLKGLDRFTKWVAQYYRECTYKGSGLDMWQYTDTGKISGIKGNVDMNHCYRDFQATSNESCDSTPAEPTAAADRPSETVKAKDPAYHFSKALAGTYAVTGSSLNIRHGAGITKGIMTAIPRGTKVQCYGYYSTALGVKWLYIAFTYGGVTYNGFASSNYLKKT